MYITTYFKILFRGESKTVENSFEDSKNTLHNIFKSHKPKGIIPSFHRLRFMIVPPEMWKTDFFFLWVIGSLQYKSLTSCSLREKGLFYCFVKKQ